MKCELHRFGEKAPNFSASALFLVSGLPILNARVAYCNVHGVKTLSYYFHAPFWKLASYVIRSN